MNINKLKNSIKEFKSTEQAAISLIDAHLEEAIQSIKKARAVSKETGVPFGVNFESGYVYIPPKFENLMTAVNDVARTNEVDMTELHTLFAEYEGTLFHECDGEYWEASAFC